jgi:hypothetical protein
MRNRVTSACIRHRSIKKNFLVALTDFKPFSFVIVSWSKLRIAINLNKYKELSANKLLDSVFNVVIYYISSLNLFNLRYAAVLEKGI